MAKEPSFQYYPKDWRADSIFTCSLAARGLWHEMMNMAHASERYGYLVTNGRPTPDEAIARYCGCTLQEYQALLPELEHARVPGRTADGILFSRRMVRDQKQRARWRKDKKNQRDRKVSVSCPQNVRTMSSPSSLPSPSASPIQKPKELPQPGFQVFWEAYPKKVAKKDALRAWARTGAEDHAGEVLASVSAWKLTEQWQDFEFIPYPATFLNRTQWKEPVPRPEQKAAGLQSQLNALMEKQHGNVNRRSA